MRRWGLRIGGRSPAMAESPLRRPVRAGARQRTRPSRSAV